MKNKHLLIFLALVATGSAAYILYQQQRIKQLNERVTTAEQAKEILKQAGT